MLFVLLTIYVWHSRMAGLIGAVLSGRDIPSAVLVSGLAFTADIPLTEGLLVRLALLVCAGLSRLREEVAQDQRTIGGMFKLCGRALFKHT